MNQPTYILQNNTRVVTHADLGGIEGFLISKDHIDARRPNAVGVIAGVVAGHGGDVYWVRHDDGKTAAYCFDEFELASTLGEPQPEPDWRKADKPPFYFSLTAALGNNTKGEVALAIAAQIIRIKDAVVRDLWREYIATHPTDPLSPLVNTIIERRRQS